MKKRVTSAVLMFSILSIWMFACEKLENESNISSHKNQDSHENGKNCMDCHYQAGPGEGWFSIAGTLEGNPDNHTVRIFDALTQDLLASVPVDKLGNLYTTEEVDFSNGITIDIIDEDNPSNPPRSMGSIVNTGQCNLCHNDVEQAKIFIP